MMLLDANILLYAYDASSQHHDRARRWLESIFSGSALVGLSWLSITAFLRISTNPRAYRTPFSVSEAARIVSDWLGCPTATILMPGERHWTLLRELLEEGQAVGPLVMDAHLGALALEHGAVLCTSDKDFSRFSRLRVLNPLMETA